MPKTATRQGTLHSFACSVCGRVQPMNPAAAALITNGRHRRVVCTSGTGCRSPFDDAERFRRWWLRKAGVSDREIRAAGGAREYVRTQGLPHGLREMASGITGLSAAA